MAIKKEVLDALLAGAEGREVFGKNGLFNDLKKALAERMLNTEMDHHLAREVEDEGQPRGNHRNGFDAWQPTWERFELANDAYWRQYRPQQASHPVDVSLDQTRNQPGRQTP